MGWDEYDPQLILFRAEMQLYSYSEIQNGGFIETIFSLCDGNAAAFESVLEMDLLTAAQFLILKEKKEFAQWYANKTIEEFRELQ